MFLQTFCFRIDQVSPLDTINEAKVRQEIFEDEQQNLVFRKNNNSPSIAFSSHR